MRWDVFCRVIDNHGDLGVCWRLARQLAQRGDTVRLWVDDTSALGWMAPRGAHGVEVRAWTGAPTAFAPTQVGDVVIEAFGCDPPAAFIGAMRARSPAPVWINLEYLSAQAYVERSHGLRSPQHAGPGAGLDKWFYFPGFTPRTGGLLREDSSPSASIELGQRTGERAVCVFSYAHAGLAALLDALAAEPSVIIAAQGPSQAALHTLFNTSPQRWPALRLHRLPWLAQPEFDAVLDACDLNIVRGEDSLVRALHARQPFLWNLYAQDDDAHRAKLEAFLDRMLDGIRDDVAVDVRAAFFSLNCFDGAPPPPLTAARLTAWHEAIAPWLSQLHAQADLVTRLVRFVDARRSG